MSKTDRQTDKSTRWAFTAYEDQWHLFKEGHIPISVAEWGWNHEQCPETNRKHYQGYVRTKQQVRFSAIQKIFPGVHLEVARDWNKLKQYCAKGETRIEGTQPVSEYSEIPDLYGYVIAVAQKMPSREELDRLVDEGQRCAQRNRVPGVAPDYALYHAESIQQMMEHKLDEVVKLDIMAGKFYAGHFAVNPQFISLWRRYGLQYIYGVKSHLPI